MHGKNSLAPVLKNNGKISFLPFQKLIGESRLYKSFGWKAPSITEEKQRQITCNSLWSNILSQSKLITSDSPALNAWQWRWIYNKTQSVAINNNWCHKIMTVRDTDKKCFHSKDARQVFLERLVLPLSMRTGARRIYISRCNNCFRACDMTKRS